MAKKALEQIGVADPKTIPLLIEDLQKDDQNVKLFASRFLGQFGVKAEGALPGLELLLNDEDEAVRNAAKSAIEKIKASE